MDTTTLEDLATLDDTGSPLFHVVAAADGDLVLCGISATPEQGMRALNVQERVRLAELSAERPALVVENERGDYVVLIDHGIDLDRYVPLSPADADLLVRRTARARFGRRDDDVLMLTPWEEDDEVEVVDLESEAFSDVPVVEREADGGLTWHRGDVTEPLGAFVRRELARLEAEPGVRFGVLTNPLGECLCVPDGAPLLPHEDIRHQTLLGTAGLLEGAQSLAGAAARLRSIAAELAAAEDAGWQLVQPIREGLGFLELPRERS